ncbi:MAG: phosphoribosylformylglycinamidine cyclo-ligase [Streptococcaceae bacterium]|jgi:phosphoribosylformylglycinamidine cyclo-ligase|nr:phosphoribosylformylglycinamidine cyclo-ligase [Streptococcaceae bacterium]
MSNAYEKAGVNIHAGYEAVERMKKHVATTTRKGVMSSLGGFGGMFDLSELNVKEPVLVSGTDGVGTKLMLAIELNKHDTIGIDAVAMCVNDIVVQGAEPLYFLDYIAVGKAVPERIEAIVKGVSVGCVQAGAALIGGETAEMPGMYDEDYYDLAGFSVGVVEKADIVTGEKIRENQVLLGLASSGIHSNGYSLVRKIIADNELSLRETYGGFNQSLGDVLLEPTRIYVKSLLALMKEVEVSGMAHITGGGFIENIPRMLPDGLGALIQTGSWDIPEIFHFLQEAGNIGNDEIYNIFNMGIGMVIALDEKDVAMAKEILTMHGETVFEIGRVAKGEGVRFK